MSNILNTNLKSVSNDNINKYCIYKYDDLIKKVHDIEKLNNVIPSPNKTCDLIEDYYNVNTIKTNETAN